MGTSNITTNTIPNKRQLTVIVLFVKRFLIKAMVLIMCGLYHGIDGNRVKFIEWISFLTKSSAGARTSDGSNNFLGGIIIVWPKIKTSPAHEFPRAISYVYNVYNPTLVFMLPGLGTHTCTSFLQPFLLAGIVTDFC